MRSVRLCLLAAVALAACLRSANAGFIEEYSVPWSAGTTVGSTDGNSHVDAAGNTWRYTETNFSLSPSWTTDAGRVSMVWGADSQWHGTTPSTGGLPLVDDLDGLRMAGGSDPYVGALEFTAAKSGTFGFTGSFGAYGPTGTALYYPVAEQIGAGPASLLAEINVAGNDTFRSTALDTITSLQDIALSAGDKLVFMVAAKNAGQFAYANLSGMKIGCVPSPSPEPASMLLLISGAIAFLLLRRPR
jgi:hypothetical protein